MTDIELIDDYPSHFSAYNRRKHRWVRGDWQILRWIQSRVPDYHRNLTENPISLISQWKIIDNLRRSLIEPGLLALLIGSWFFLPGPPGYWTLAAIAMLFLPVYFDLLFALLHMPFRRRALAAWTHETAKLQPGSHHRALRFDFSAAPGAGVNRRDHPLDHARLCHQAQAAAVGNGRGSGGGGSQQSHRGRVSGMDAVAGPDDRDPGLAAAAFRAASRGARFGFWMASLACSAWLNRPPGR